MNGTEPTIEAAFISTSEVKKIMGLSKETILEMRKRGEFGPKDIRIGSRLLRWNRIEFMNWIAAGCPNAAEWRKPKDATVNG